MGKSPQKQKQQRRYHCPGVNSGHCTDHCPPDGVVPRLPRQRIAGDVAMGYYGYAYDIYMLLLLVSSNGVPLAVSKLVCQSPCQTGLYQ